MPQHTWYILWGLPLVTVEPSSWTIFLLVNIDSCHYLYTDGYILLGFALVGLEPSSQITVFLNYVPQLLSNRTLFNQTQQLLVCQDTCQTLPWHDLEILKQISLHCTNGWKSSNKQVKHHYIEIDRHSLQTCSQRVIVICEKLRHYICVLLCHVHVHVFVHVK